MSKSLSDHLEAILRSEAVAGWQARLAGTFFEPEGKRQVIQAIRQGVADLAAGLKEAELEELRQAVIRHLVGLASRDARPPQPEPDASPVPSSADLEDRVVQAFPYPIAMAYSALTEQVSAVAAFGCLLDTFEGLVHFLAAVTVSAYLRSGPSNPDCNRHLLERFAKGAWATGDLLALLRDTVRLAGSGPNGLPYAELAPYLFTRQGRPTTSLQVLEAFVSLRNRCWGHGTGRDEDFYQAILPANRARLEQELARAHWLDSWELVRPVQIDEAGRVTRADLLMGMFRRKSRAYDLALAPADLDANGGMVQVDKTLLLVAPDRGRYLPLFPLSLFSFQLRSQGVYFLQRLQWHAEQHRLRKTVYVAYESGLGEHEEQPGDLAVRVLEGQIRQLEESLAQADTGPVTLPPAEPDDPDCELPEVRHEQEYHLRTFAGREALLQELTAWVGGAGSGYLLLLGGPGQGKSALLAELARREGERGGCLLHMVKSHRSPTRFVPALLSQAARLTGKRFGADAYRGDLDDLRNALLRALEAVRQQFGRAVLLLDALDEMEGAERLAFLPEALPDGVRVVLTCRPDLPLVGALRARLRQIEEKPLPALARDDLPLVLQRRLEKEPGQLPEMHGLLDWQELFDRVQGNPLFLHRALDRLARAITVAQLARSASEGNPLARSASEGTTSPAAISLDTLPATLEDLFQDIYAEISEKEGTRYRSVEGRHKARLLQLMCVAREPLRLEELSDLLLADGTPLSLEDCRDRVFEMSAFLLDVGGGRFKPWHQGLTDFIRLCVLGTAGCVRAEEVFCDWLRRPAARATGYGLRHRPHHLVAAGRLDEAADLLTDPAFLEAKALTGLVFELVTDFALAVEALPAAHPKARLLRLLEEALRTDIHFLDRHPDCLFQTLWNRGWWYDSPHAEPFYHLAAGTRSAGGQPWERTGLKLADLLESWRKDKETRTPGFVWVRSLRPPPMRLGTAQQALFSGHTSQVMTVAFSADGARLASGSKDRAVRVWDVHHGAEQACLTGHAAAVQGVAFSPDGRWLASGSLDQTVRLWNASGAEQACWRGHTGGVQCVVFSHDGKLLASAGRDHTIRLWDVPTGEQRACWRGHADKVMSLAFGPDGQCLVSGSSDRTVRLWDVATGRERHRLTGHTDRVTSVAFAPDGTRLASGASDRTVRLWDAVSGAQQACLAGHEDWVTGVAFAPDGTWLVSSSGDDTLRVWDVASGTALACLRGHSQSVQATAVSPDGRRIASASWDGTVRLWAAAGGEDWLPLRGHEDMVVRVAFSPDGGEIVSCSRDGTLRFWDVASGTERGCIRGHEKEVWSVVYSPDGARVASGSWDHTVRVWEAASRAEVLCLRGHQDRVRAVAFSADGSRLVSASDDRTARVWDAAGVEMACFRDHKDTVGAVAFSPDGLLAASGSDDRTVRVWDVVSGSERACFRGHSQRILRVAFSPDGRRVVSLSRDNTLRVWDLERGQCCEVIRGNGDVAAVAAGAGRFPWRALVRPLETVVESAVTGRPMAWLPDKVFALMTHPSGRTWAGVNGMHFYLCTLEGRPPR